MQPAIQHQQRVVQAVLDVGQIRSHRLQLTRLVLKLVVDGHQLFVGRLQFLVRGLQLFVGRLQLFVGGLQLFGLRLQLLVGCFQLFNDRLQVLACAGQFTLQLGNDQVVTLILVIEGQRFGGRNRGGLE